MFISSVFSVCRSDLKKKKKIFSFSELGQCALSITYTRLIGHGLLLLLVSAAHLGHGKLHEQGQHASWRGGRFQDHLSHTGILQYMQ